MQTRDKLGRDRNKHGIERPRGPGLKCTQDTDNLGIGSWEEPGSGSQLIRGLTLSHEL
jgi:hypothetical protein